MKLNLNLAEAEKDIIKWTEHKALFHNSIVSCYT